MDSLASWQIQSFCSASSLGRVEKSLQLWQRLFLVCIFLPPLTYFLVCQSNSIQKLINFFQKTNTIQNDLASCNLLYLCPQILCHLPCFQTPAGLTFIVPIFCVAQLDNLFDTKEETKKSVIKRAKIHFLLLLLELIGTSGKHWGGVGVFLFQFIFVICRSI